MGDCDLIEFLYSERVLLPLTTLDTAGGKRFRRSVDFISASFPQDRWRNMMVLRPGLSAGISHPGGGLRRQAGSK